MGGIVILLISIKLFIDTDSLPFGLIKEESQNIRAIALLVSFLVSNILYSIPVFWNKRKKERNKKKRLFKLCRSKKINLEQKD